MGRASGASSTSCRCGGCTALVRNRRWDWIARWSLLAAAKLFMEQKGTTVAGRRIELITRDDGGVPDQAKRIAQEFVVGVPAPDDRHAMSQT
jgi:hypothetical protein